MPASPTQKSVASTGNQRVWWVPAAQNPLSVAVLNGATTKDVTFSLNGTGLANSTNESSIPDGRFGSRQVFNKRGNFSEEIAIEYLFGDAADIAAAAMTEGVKGFVVHRRAIDNAVDPVVGQKVTVYSGELGKQIEQPATENSIDTIKQALYIDAPTLNRQALVA